ncbi:MAG: retention module-containing protein, partial [Marinobacter sp.]|nr:retention module-containing protein [Marinobacter sp.]
MAAAQIEVISLNGELFLVRDGNLEPVSEGQVLEVVADQANLLVGEGGNAVVMVNGNEFELGANASLDIPIADDLEGEATEQSLADGSIDDLLQALEGDQDLLELVEEPAAGAEGGEGGDGHGFVRLLRISESIDELGLAAPDAAAADNGEVTTDFDGGADAGAAVLAEGVSAEDEGPVDTIAPAVPSITLNNDTGDSATDSLTNDGSYTVGNLEAGAIVEYSTDGGSSWSTEAPEAVEGENTIQVRQTDEAGNISEPGELSFTLDTQASATITIDAVAGDDVVNAAEAGQDVTITGTVGGDAKAGDTVTLSVNSNEYTGQVAENGSGELVYTIDVPGSDLRDDADSTIEASVTGTDAAGNAFTATTDTTGANADGDYEVDTDVATPTITLTNDTGDSDSDLITKDGSYTVGNLEAGATVEYSTDGGTTWVTDAPVAEEGANTIQVRQTDEAGNISEPGELSFTLDTQASATITI